MKTTSIKHNWFKDSGLRLDASYHLSDGVKTKRTIEKFCPYPTICLSDEADELFKGNIHKRVYVPSPKGGVTFFTASDLFKNSIDSGKYISKKYSLYLKELELKKDWILITRSGTLGKVVFTTSDLESKIGTDDLVRIKPKDDKIKKGYLYAFLASKYGYGLLTQSGYGGVVKHIEPHHLEKMEIPELPLKKQLYIDNLIKESSNLRVQANALLNEANSKFIKSNELNYTEEILDISENKIQTGFTVKSEKISPLTFKARNYSFRSQKLMDYWSNKEGITLTNYLDEPFSMGARASFKRITSLNFKGNDLISQGDIHKRNPKIFKQVKAKKTISESDKAQRSTLIMPSAGTLGENEIFTRPLLIRNNFEGKLLSEVIGKFQCKSEIDAAYLYVALSSKASFRILRSMVYGTNLLYPNWKLIKDLNIPIKSEKYKNDIGKIVLDAFDKIGEADKKENKAINLVEKEIEEWEK